MRVHRLHHTQRLPIDLDEAWDFFSDPRNLAEITPDEMGFRITNSIPERVSPGTIITYTVTPLFGIPLTWVTEITDLCEREYFVDEQRFGPYRMWHHVHRFAAIDGGVWMEDTVDYVMPFWPLGDWVHSLFVARQLNDVFAYRRAILAERFGVWPPTNG